MSSAPLRTIDRISGPKNMQKLWLGHLTLKIIIYQHIFHSLNFSEHKLSNLIN